MLAIAQHGSMTRSSSRRPHRHTPTYTQGLDNAAILKPVTKFTAEVPSSDCISEVLANAFRAAEMVGRPGAAFVSLPQVRGGAADSARDGEAGGGQRVRAESGGAGDLVKL